jgi:competence protein ComEC
MAMVACAAGLGRAAGAAVIALAGALWAAAPRPDILIAADGRLVGVMGEQGRWLSRAEGAGFAAEAWLENDGDPARQAEAAARTRDASGPELRVLRGRTGLPEALAECELRALWLVTPVAAEGPSGRCLIFDRDRLAMTGAVAVHLGANGPRIVYASEMQGARPWTRSGRDAAGPALQ